MGSSSPLQRVEDLHELMFSCLEVQDPDFPAYLQMLFS